MTDLVAMRRKRLEERFAPRIDLCAAYSGLLLGLLRIVLLLCVCNVSFARDSSAEKELLLQNGIKSDVASLHQFFDAMNPKGDVVKNTRELLDQIGSDDFVVRETATTSLLLMPQVSLELVREYSQKKDPEVVWRSSLVLAEAGSRGKRLLTAALRLIEVEQIKGFGRDIFSCSHYYDSKSLQRLSLRALLATVEKSDAETLRAAGKHKDPQVRILSVRGFANAFGSEAEQDLEPFLADDNDEVRSNAAAVLGNQGNRKALMTLAELLEADDLNIRSRSVQLLRKFTNQDFKFVAYAPSKDRAKAVKAWGKWLSVEANLAEVVSGVEIDRLKVGRILVCYYNTNRVVEYDEEHNVVWEKEVQQPWGCQGLANGHRLISSFAANAVIEYDASGKEVWRASVSGNPSMAQRLDNGNTLVSVYSQSKVIEVDMDGKTVNSITVSGPPAFAERTEDGHTLVAVQNAKGAVEFDVDGKEIKRHAGSNVFSARRVANGNLLVSDSAKSAVSELDPDGKTVWTKTFANPLDAIRLDNGNTMVAHQGGVTEVSPDGEEVWAESTKGQGIRISAY